MCFSKIVLQKYLTETLNYDKVAYPAGYSTARFRQKETPMNRHNAAASFTLRPKGRAAAALRLLSLFLALCCFWSFAGAGVALAAASQKSDAAPHRTYPHFQHTPILPAVVSPFLALSSAALSSAPAVVTHFSPQAALPPSVASATLLDEVGHLTHPVAPSEAQGWSHALAASPAPAQAALLHLWLGEWQLAANEQPETALRHFHEARARLPHTDRLYGLASYDTAIAFFKEGAYADANDAFARLLAPKTALPGYSRKKCALWLRHAAVCAGYHAERSAQGIPEPPRLDPLCGAAAMAAGLQAIGLPSDKKTLLAACRVTGEGSSLKDIRDAGRTLGVSVDAVTADDQGLMALPKPLVAHVEHDHFVALIRADKRGVSYLCSDCGPWPGGRVDLTWAQWHLLEPDVYSAVCLKGGVWDQTLLALGTTPGAGTIPGVRVASAGRLLHLGNSLKIAMRLSKLGKHILRYDWSGSLPECNLRWDALKCADCLVCCFFDALGGGNHFADGSLGGGMSGHFMSGASGGDPVNLATGEEEYRPAADLTVYNPHGPSVQWTRLYDSLRDGFQTTSTYETDDYGVGWSQGYNVGVRNPNSVASGPDPHILTGAASPVIVYGGAGYSGAISWVINQNSTTVASSSSPNAWNITSTIDAQGVNHYAVAVPMGAAPGTYSWTYYQSTYLQWGTFVVQPAAPSVGTKSVYLANGGVVTFTAPSVPSAGTPRVVCTPQAGSPFLAEWDYDSGSAWGHFVITWKDRTKWVTTSADGQSQYVLHQIVDRNGNAISFNYSAPVMVSTRIGQSQAPVTYAYDNFPLLSTITDAGTGTTLLTINRKGGVITSLSDCYGRSVAYASAVLGPNYVPTATLTHASQIIPTASLGSSSIPDKYAFGYSYYTDDQGNSDPVLHTITVPSPAGPTPATASLSVNETGTSTATINYSDGGAGTVSSLVDGNGNTRTYTACTASGTPTSNGTLTNYTKVTVTDKNNNVVYSYIGGVDMYMSGKSVTDGSGHLLMSQVFSDAHDPYRPLFGGGRQRQDQLYDVGWLRQHDFHDAAEQRRPHAGRDDVHVQLHQLRFRRIDPGADRQQVADHVCLL